MNIQQITIQIPDYAKDIRLNLQNVLSEAGSPGITLEQITAIALASSYACEHADLSNSIEKEYQHHLTDSVLQAARAANSIMAMNNIYYRFIHALEEPEWHALPARLRMNILGKPGIDHSTFELMCLAISMINGCGLCMKAHTQTLQKQGVTTEGIQSVARIAAVIHAVAKTLSH